MSMRAVASGQTAETEVPALVSEPENGKTRTILSEIVFVILAVISGFSWKIRVFSRRQRIEIIQKVRLSLTMLFVTAVIMHSVYVAEKMF